MENFYECLLLKHGIAWGAGAGIFLLTILLVARGKIGFFSSLILIFIALGTSMAIEHQGQTIAYWNKFLPDALKINKETSSATTATEMNAPTNLRSTPQNSRENEIDVRGQSEKQKQRVNTFTPP